MEGSITFEGQDMLSKTKDEMIAFRGKEGSNDLQNPMTCLNLYIRSENQLVEALHMIKSVPKKRMLKTRNENAGSWYQQR